MSDKRKLDSVKREAGEIPARTRRCERGALFQPCAVIGFSEKTKQSDDTQVRRPACSEYCVTTRAWLVRNKADILRKLQWCVRYFVMPAFALLGKSLFIYRNLFTKIHS